MANSPFTYTVTSGNTFTVTAEMGFTKISVMVAQTAGGTTTGTITGSTVVSGTASSAITLGEGSSATFVASDGNPVISGLTITAGTGANVLIMAMQF